MSFDKKNTQLRKNTLELYPSSKSHFQLCFLRSIWNGMAFEKRQTISPDVNYFSVFAFLDMSSCTKDWQSHYLFFERTMPKECNRKRALESKPDSLILSSHHKTQLKPTTFKRTKGPPVKSRIPRQRSKQEIPFCIGTTKIQLFVPLFTKFDSACQF